MPLHGQKVGDMENRFGSIAASRLQRLYDTSKEANTALISLPLLSLFGAPGGSLVPELRIRPLCHRSLPMHPSQKGLNWLPTRMPCRINREMGLDLDRLVQAEYRPQPAVRKMSVGHG